VKCDTPHVAFSELRDFWVLGLVRSRALGYVGGAMGARGDAVRN
jgi:hypothetical protein